MNQQSLADDLDQQIEALMTGKSIARRPELDSLLLIAAELRAVPDPKFKIRLKFDLMQEAEAAEPISQTAGFQQAQGAMALTEILPTLSGKQFGIFPADHRSFLVSFASHAALVLLIASGIWVGARPVVEKHPLTSELTFPLDGRGGGGSGDRSPIPATMGTPPKFSDQQLTSPAIVVRNLDPKLAVQPTVIGPPDIKLPQSTQIGDWMSSNAVLPSNGTGTGGAAG